MVFCLFTLLFILETELIAMRAQAETHSQEIHEMEEKLMALSEELDGAKARISELTSKNAVIEAVKCDLEAKLEELITKKENVKLEEEKIHQKGTHVHVDKSQLLLYCGYILDTELATLRETLENRGKKIHELEDKCMMLRDELNSSLAKLAVKQEAMYKLEEAKENL